MTYSIKGLDPAAFTFLVGADEELLASHNAVRVTATAKPGYPCRISLEDAEPGETLILLNHVSHDVASPYRSSYAIYVREAADAAASHVDSIPPVFEGRPLGLRGFDSDGMLRKAMLALPGTADSTIREMLVAPEIAYIDAHNAAHGCFAARIERD
ncbi:DUF1203 domain-containing protein [Sphingomonas sp.]|uniref:DUF1203 domain-containing protein n=1 Tax=Sphingomonas sp. TaxID=28214 RepID=UPI00286B6CCD|nr:DUF1203 domain-containing protein [Sphingomonas sp.]